MQHEVTNGRDPICNMKLPMVGTLYVTERYQGLSFFWREMCDVIYNLPLQEVNRAATLRQSFWHSSISIVAILLEITRRMSGIVCGFSLYTMSLGTPHKKKSIGDKLGKRAGHSNGPRRPIHLSLKFMSGHS